MQSRRDFIYQSIFSASALAAAGCVTGGKRMFDFTSGAPMQGFADKPMDTVRIGVVGMGGRGYAAIRRFGKIPGARVTAICDNVKAKLEKSQKRLADCKMPKAREYYGEEEWRRLCEDPEVDVVYNTTPWELHMPVIRAAIEGGKHVMTEVPSVLTVDDAWEAVELAEKHRRHCMQLENCCYGPVEMLTLSLARQGVLGELVHAEGAYIHDLRGMTVCEWPNNECWRYDWNRDHKGNYYPTHGLVPLCLTLGINRGDKFDYLVSLESRQANMKRYLRDVKPDHRRNADDIQTGDMNTTLIKTALGRSIMMQHDVSTPRPYSRLGFLSGTKGAIAGWPMRVAIEKEAGKGAHKWLSAESRNEKECAEFKAFVDKYQHPMFKTAGAIAKKMSADHGGMDYLMDLRWVYCLRQGLPLDMDVYDLASTGCLCELTERSVRNRSEAVNVPDFTRGAWKTATPLGLENIDIRKAGFGDDVKGPEAKADKDTFQV